MASKLRIRFPGEWRGGIYLDLESERDRAKLLQTELYLNDHRDRLLVFDEIHRAPNLLPLLRGAIDRARHRKP